MNKKETELIRNLDNARALVQTGLHYCNNLYDKERYEELQNIIAKLYGSLLRIDQESTVEALKKNFGHATPKIGVEAAIFDEPTHLLLIRRRDDNRWALPGGWVEVNERLNDAIEREVQEETGLKVRAECPLVMESRLAGEFDRPHSACFIVYSCSVIGGDISKSEEAVDIGYFEPNKVTDWHKDHRARALLSIERHRGHPVSSL